jgi:hypothetical protein
MSSRLPNCHPLALDVAELFSRYWNDFCCPASDDVTAPWQREE